MNRAVLLLPVAWITTACAAETGSNRLTDPRYCLHP